MGLDMYLYAKLFTSEYFDKDINTKLQRITKDIPHHKSVFGIPSINITKNIGYWRKANHIHIWFVNKSEEGIDDCNDIIIDRSDLIELRNLCQKILEDNKLAEELLPTQSGFFFGGTEYDEYYFKDLETTIEIIDVALSLPERWDFVYRASW